MFESYEHKTDKLAPKAVFYRRLINNFLLALFIIFISLLIGIFGYHFLGPASWIDSFHNASMILSGMGPVITIQSTTGKLFSSFYALFCGFVFISNIGIILAPGIHRLYHRLHLQEK